MISLQSVIVPEMRRGHDVKLKAKGAAASLVTSPKAQNPAAKGKGREWNASSYPPQQSRATIVIVGMSRQAKLQSVRQGHVLLLWPEPSIPIPDKEAAVDVTSRRLS